MGYNNNNNNNNTNHPYHNNYTNLQGHQHMYNNNNNNHTNNYAVQIHNNMPPAYTELNLHGSNHKYTASPGPSPLKQSVAQHQAPIPGQTYGMSPFPRNSFGGNMQAQIMASNNNPVIEIMGKPAQALFAM
jgi:hypothetical protein